MIVLTMYFLLMTASPDRQNSQSKNMQIRARSLDGATTATDLEPNSKQAGACSEFATVYCPCWHRPIDSFSTRRRKGLMMMVIIQVMTRRGKGGGRVPRDARADMVCQLLMEVCKFLVFTCLRQAFPVGSQDPGDRCSDAVAFSNLDSISACATKPRQDLQK